MDYGDILPSAVPHITTLDQSFQMQFDFYIYSLLTEIMFLLIAFPFLAFAMYFTIKNPQKPKKVSDSTSEIQCERTMNQHEELSIEENIFQSKTLKKIKKKEETSSQKRLKRLISIERRLEHFLPFLICHVIVANSFDSSFLFLAIFPLQVLIFALFNIMELGTQYKVVKGLYILPALLSAIPYFIGNHTMMVQ